MGSFEPIVNESAIADSTTAGTYDVTYSLGSDLTGVIKNFTPQSAVSSDFVDGSHFKIKRTDAYHYGEVFFRRGL